MSERGRKDGKRKRQGIVPPQAPKKRVCPECGGYGMIPANPCELRHDCPLCRGTGKVEEVEDAE